MTHQSVARNIHKCELGDHTMTLRLWKAAYTTNHAVRAFYDLGGGVSWDKPSAGQKIKHGSHIMNHLEY